MKISKYLHSCLVFEQDGHKILFDPGKFSFAEGLVTPEMFADVNHIIITHNHPDHIDMDNLKAIVRLSGAPILANSEVATVLAKEGLESVLVEEGDYIVGPFKLHAIPVVHQPLLDSPMPKMTGFVINDKVLHPVDSMQDNLSSYKGIELLVLVVMAPFADELKIADFAAKIHPKQILPVHDGYAKDFFTKQRYKLFDEHFESQGIKFNGIYKSGDNINI